MRHPSAILLIIFASAAATATAQLAVENDRKFAWGENIGWTNWRDADDSAAGVMLHDTVLSGFAWAENVGWINFGDGAPTDGMHYDNLTGADFGVNVDPVTNVLFGLAWGENIGWINFDTEEELVGSNQHARYDPATGRLLGYAWGENVGWINLDDDTHFIQFEEETGGANGDCDDDGDVDLLDFQQFQLCFSGMDQPANPGCECADFDGDSDVDLIDFGQFQLAFTG
jgi:hypothetical protein